MTVIAVENRNGQVNMAADSMTSISDFYLGPANGQKIFRHEVLDRKFLIGCSGAENHLKYLQHWLEESKFDLTLDFLVLQIMLKKYRSYIEENYLPIDEDEHVSCFLLADEYGGIFQVFTNGAISFWEGYHAIGSGEDFVLGAMAAGKTASEAVDLAIASPMKHCNAPKVELWIPQAEGLDRAANTATKIVERSQHGYAVNGNGRVKGAIENQPVLLST